MARQLLVEQQAALVDFLDDLLTEEAQTEAAIPVAEGTAQLSVTQVSGMSEDDAAMVV